MIFELTEELKIISEINDHVKNIIPKKLSQKCSEKISFVF